MDRQTGKFNNGQTWTYISMQAIWYTDRLMALTERQTDRQVNSQNER